MDDSDHSDDSDTEDEDAHWTAESNSSEQVQPHEVVQPQVDNAMQVLSCDGLSADSIYDASTWGEHLSPWTKNGMQ